MPGRLGPRFALEAGFLILLAVALGLADLDTLTIVAVMAVAWLLVALIEWIVSREDATAVRAAEQESFVAATAMPPATDSPRAAEGEAAGPETAPEAEAASPAEPSRRRWFRRPRREREQAGEEA